MPPDEVERHFAAMLDEARLPRFTSTFHDAEIDELVLRWDHGFALHVDLTRRDWEPIDEWERDSILGVPLEDRAPIDVYVPASGDDPRDAPPIPGVKIRRGPPLHPDDLTVHKGIPVTSPSRTLIDCAEEATIDELRAMFARAKLLGLLDPEAMRAARARVEWRPSLAMLDRVIDEWC